MDGDVNSKVGGARGVELRWAARVPFGLVRRLYESDALGLLDEDLLDEVGVALFARCDALIKSAAARRGEDFDCPSCSGPMRFHFTRPWGTVGLTATCEACGWRLGWDSFRHGYRHNKLGTGNAAAVYFDFVEKYPRAKTAREKLLLIDGLLHEFHRNRRGPGRPVGTQVLEGNVGQVLRFLDELAYSGELAAGKEDWRRRAPASVFGRHLAGNRKEDPA